MENKKAYLSPRMSFMNETLEEYCTTLVLFRDSPWI